MVYVVITGRLGNILFQIATARSLDNEIAAIAMNPITKSVFLDYKDTLFRGIELLGEIPNGIPVYEEKGYSFCPISYTGDKIILKGYYQSYKYLDKEICEEIYKCPTEIQSHIDSLFRTLKREKTVSLHVRRGDYLKLPHRHPFCGLDYYRKAISYFDDDYQFIVLSDDIPWCKSHFKGEKFIFVENSNPLVDLYIQTCCRHNIISNSSFSWWGAFLNTSKDHVVIAPKRWYGPELSKTNPVGDLIPNNYILMDCSTSFGQCLLTQCLLIKGYIKKLMK